ncbi:MAG: hypothetical protein ABIJ97_09755 [Bacteroidota bacterium]
MERLKIILQYLSDQSDLLEYPFYLYDSKKIREKCQIFNSLPYKNKSVHFATMSNSNSDFLQIIKGEGIKVFINSLKHLDIVKQIGYKNDDIVFTSSALDEKTLKIIHKENIILNLDSINQLSLWQKLFPGTKVGLRCNLISSEIHPNTTRAGYFIGPESRLGITIDELNSIKNKEIINGLHIYVGTDILDVDYFIKFYKFLMETALIFPFLSYLDIGGGFGLDDKQKKQFNFNKFGEKLYELMLTFSKKIDNNIKLLLEPGRIIGGESGYFICKVTDIKFRNEIQYIGVNASSVQFPRPLFYPGKAIHPVWILSKNGEIKKSTNPVVTKIMGCSTYSRDYLAHKVILPKAEIGEIIIFGHAGAYCASAYTEFLGFPKPKEIFI